MRKTKDEINLEVSTLDGMKPYVLRFSMFGDDNHAAIDAQINVLSNQMSVDDLYETYGDSDEELDDSDFSQSVFDAALEAHDWMAGVNSELPSESWKPLLRTDANPGTGK